MSSDGQVFESYRPLLFSIAYRMLGTAMEAEDMVQEAYLRFDHAHDQALHSTKAYLVTIVTRLCLDHLKSAKTQRESYVGTWLPEPLITSDSPDELANLRESISMAFLLLLEHLSPMERAIWLLRDVFDYRYAEIAAIVGKTEANCRRYYHRAKQFLSERRPRYQPSSDEQIKLVESFLGALATGNLGGLTALLAEDAALYGDGGGKAPAVRHPIFGHEAVSRFLLLGVSRQLPADAHITLAEINGAPSLLFIGEAALYFVMHLTITDNRITTIRNILNPDKLSYLRQQRARSGGAWAAPP
jgi:RNA polymerase sigma-70 factor, ECF subfamily